MGLSCSETGYRVLRHDHTVFRDRTYRVLRHGLPCSKTGRTVFLDTFVGES
jgi:hypothetical protein